jgi:hypothetical protein
MDGCNGKRRQHIIMIVGMIISLCTWSSEWCMMSGQTRLCLFTG